MVPHLVSVRHAYKNMRIGSFHQTRTQRVIVVIIFLSKKWTKDNDNLVQHHKKYMAPQWCVEQAGGI